MIALSDNEWKKIVLLEKLFQSLSIDDLTELTEREEIVARLKGTETNKNLFSNVINEHNQGQMEQYRLQNEIQTLKSDLTNLIRVVNNLYQPTYSQELQNLKSKYNVY